MKPKTIGYISIIALLSVTGFFSVNLYFRQRSSHDEVDIRTFPYTIGDWTGTDLDVTEEEYRILETRNLILREYTNPSAERLVVFIIYSETNRSVFHPPEVCLIGSGIKIADKRQEKIKNSDGKTISVSKIYTEKNNYRDLSLYCYKAGNFYTDNYYLQQAYFAFNQLFKSNIKGATINVSMPLAKDEKAALETLKTFLRESAKIIDNL